VPPALPPVVPLAVPLPELLVVPLEVPPLVALGTLPVALGTLPGRAGTDGTVGPREASVGAPLVVVPPLADPATPGVLNPAAPPVEVAGGVMTTVDPVVPVVPVGVAVEPVAGGMLRTAPLPSGKRHVTSRFEQNSGIVVRSLEASAA
jgi:hypothetical protein